jgi:predicted MFS family arabinose efflux permease
LGAFYVQQHGVTTQGVGWIYMIVSLGVMLGSLTTGGRLGRLPLRPLLLGSRLAMGMLMGATMALPVVAPTSVGLMTLSAIMLGVGIVATAILLTGETPTGRATTMAFNQSANSLGQALGSALGGLLLAVSGFEALGVSALLWCIASAGLIWWSGSALPRLASAGPAAGDG